ncbi:MAG: hypothetical protein OZSIB_2223 [Candidatus Ozemobacter sibiricus]|jgi:predicted esterase|uniref:Serine aminopeptidase S33 domain-containing protein n=1 Tax=Candidatus Ozemobacter sibiricus TaxID=2268124 RepID=A0A367ZT83_9BACT|nr:MAG: hypothetical protein OZSIB_2223 [Candidatus Ozemobacter sibiricus]
MMKERCGAWSRGKLLLGALLAIAAALLAMVWGFAMQNVRRPRLGPPAAFPDHLFMPFAARNDQGQTIRAWYASGTPGLGTMLLCHGHGVDHTNLAAMVDFLRRFGCALLLLDFRAHGASDGEYTSIGLYEWADLRGVLDEARARGFLATGTALAAYGRSMGAATLINGAARLPEIQAFILESPFAELRLIGGRDFARLTGLPDSFLTDVGFHLISWWTGIPYLDNRPVAATAGFGERPVLLIHDTLDPRATRADHDRLKAAIPQARELIVPGASHVQAHQVASTTFETTVIGFLRDVGFPLP